MIDYLKANHLSLLIVAYLVLSSMMGGAAEPLGAGDITTFTNPITFADDIVAQNDVDLAGEIDLTDGTFCIDFFATSTATAQKMTASTTATIEGTDGVVVFAYGSC